MKYLQYIALLLAVVASGCIAEDRSGCVPAESGFNLNIVVVDAAGEDITESGEAGNVEVFVFDFNLQFTEQKPLSAAEVVNHVPYVYTYQTSADLWFVAWSNLNGAQEVTPLVQGLPKEEALVQLRRDADGYAISPDDLFFGLKPFNLNASIPTADLVIERKTGLMALSVAGLDPAIEDEYTFILTGALDDAYDFGGNLRGNPIDYRQTGTFDEAGILNSPPFRVYPLREGIGFTISVYQGDTLIIAVNTDQNGNLIRPVVGETVNVLIELAAATVTVVVTDWNTFNQGVIW